MIVPTEDDMRKYLSVPERFEAIALGAIDRLGMWLTPQQLHRYTELYKAVRDRKLAATTGETT